MDSENKRSNDSVTPSSAGRRRLSMKTRVTKWICLGTGLSADSSIEGSDSPVASSRHLSPARSPSTVRGCEAAAITPTRQAPSANSPSSFSRDSRSSSSGSTSLSTASTSSDSEAEASSDGEVDCKRSFDLRARFKEGQRFVTPPVGDATRMFYESLLRERPSSKMSIKFCVEHGVLPIEKHEKLFKKYTALKQAGAYRQGGHNVTEAVGRQRWNRATAKKRNKAKVGAKAKDASYAKVAAISSARRMRQAAWGGC
mmetsp:Transcript_112754/g.318720  ORF Transcript_112754/g.318720 Transcript_112754/m.318720 type:complete len:256 (+) Transcript_112754:124-891(+)|eukprot:CAMPEP_0117500882 /NCGR_PEP_ID=MMETSP0784-20121206/23007_1 /TAXON_ID=39447 /ORGANISM="" /LENGTH=255 /DNA_ID=CAMNT_0005296109 /DNA_START=124 /DNA_END=891 /DNA_ORIENTATION=+